MPWWCRCCGRGVAHTQSSIASPAPTSQQTPVHLLAHFSGHPRNQKLSVSTSRTSWSGTRSTRPQHLQLLGFTLLFFCAGHLCIPFLLQGSAPTSVSQVSTQWWLDESEVHVPLTASTQRWFDKSGARMPCANQRSKKQTYRRTTLTHQFTQHKTLSLLHVFFFFGERLRKGSVAERRHFQGRAQEHRR